MAISKQSTSHHKNKVDEILYLENLSKKFNGIQAVNALTQEILRNKIVALIGPNGSGKTTVFNLISGFESPDSGQIYFEGKIIKKKRPDQISRLGIARTFQNIRLFPQITVMDNILLALTNHDEEKLIQTLVRTGPFREKIRKYSQQAEKHLESAGLHEKRKHLAGELSQGQRRLLEISMAIALKSTFILLDEPMAGLFPGIIENIKQIMFNLKKEGKTVFFIEHNIEVVMSVADWILVMDNGKIIAQGTPVQIQSDETVVRTYLGRMTKEQKL